MRLRWYGQSAFLLESAEGHVLFVPVGGGPTIDPAQAATVARELRARWIVPMHYRTPAADFVGPVEPFLDAFEDVLRLDGPEAEIDPAAWPGGPQVVLPRPPDPR